MSRPVAVQNRLHGDHPCCRHWRRFWYLQDLFQSPEKNRSIFSGRNNGELFPNASFCCGCAGSIKGALSLENPRSGLNHLFLLRGVFLLPYSCPMFLEKGDGTGCGSPCQWKPGGFAPHYSKPPQTGLHNWVEERLSLTTAFLLWGCFCSRAGFLYLKRNAKPYPHGESKSPLNALSTLTPSFSYFSQYRYEFGL